MKLIDSTRDRSTAPDAAVHVWLLALSRAGAIRDTLSPDEAARAERFPSTYRRERWIAARVGLRSILAAYTGRAARALRFRYGRHGKPALIHAPGEPDLRFNLSHSRDLALIAVANGRELGVDLEALDSRRDIHAIAARVLSPHEQAAFATLAFEQRLRGFFTAWARKEAFIKARGDAVWPALQAFDVSLVPGEPARLLDTRPDPEEAARWTLCDVDVGPQFAAALAFDGPDCPVIVRRWD